MKVLVIDDEPLARIGMRSIIPWEENGFTLVGEARDGYEGLDLSRRFRPDLILVDIVMPRMDGLTFIREVRKILPNVKLIIMSCMAETEYLREAIRLGVSEYILKDKIDPADIMETVKRVVGEIRKERVLEDGEAAETVNNNLVLQQFMNMVFQGKIQDTRKIADKLHSEGFEMQNKQLRAAFLELDYQTEEAEDFLDYSVLSVCHKVLNESMPSVVFVTGKKQLAVLMELQLDISVSFLQRMFIQLRDTVLQCLDCTVTMGVSDPFSEPARCSGGFGQARQAEENGFFYGKGQLYLPHMYTKQYAEEPMALLKRILKLNAKTAFPELLSLLPLLLSAIRQSGLSPKHCGEIYGDVYSHIKTIIRSVCKSWEDPILVGLQSFSSLEDFQDAEVYGRELYTYLASIQPELSLRGSTEGENPVELIRQYVDSHIEGKMSLHSISNAVYLSPSYVCRIFKRETGENLQDYIVTRKMEHAAQLLKTRRTGEVADIMAFNSHSYFIKLFKKQYGLTPFQYKKSLETDKTVISGAENQ